MNQNFIEKIATIYLVWELQFAENLLLTICHLQPQKPQTTDKSLYLIEQSSKYRIKKLGENMKYLVILQIWLLHPKRTKFPRVFLHRRITQNSCYCKQEFIKISMQWILVHPNSFLYIFIKKYVNFLLYGIFFYSFTNLLILNILCIPYKHVSLIFEYSSALQLLLLSCGQNFIFLDMLNKNISENWLLRFHHESHFIFVY